MDLIQCERERWSEGEAAAALHCISALFTSLSASLLLGAAAHTVFISERSQPVAGRSPAWQPVTLRAYLSTRHHGTWNKMIQESTLFLPHFGENPVHNLQMKVLLHHAFV